MSPYTNYVCEVIYHLVLVTKDREACLSLAMQQRLEEIVAEFCLKLDTELITYTADEYYIGMTIKAGTTFTASKFINSLKTITSRLLRKEFSQHMDIYYSGTGLWEKGYLFVTKSVENEQSLIKNYIHN